MTTSKTSTTRRATTISRVLAARGSVNNAPGSARQVQRLGGGDQDVPERDDSSDAGGAGR